MAAELSRHDYMWSETGQKIGVRCGGHSYGEASFRQGR
jgi:hypothetical protein